MTRWIALAGEIEDFKRYLIVSGPRLTSAIRMVLCVLTALVQIATAKSLRADLKNSAWQPIGISGGGALYNPAVSPFDSRAMLVDSDMGGRYVSADGGATWSILHYSQATASIRGGPPLFHPTREGVVFALNGYDANRISVSLDNGRTWTMWDAARQPTTKATIARMYIDVALPVRLFLGTSVGEILFTDDEGAHWIQSAGAKGAVLNFAVQSSSPKSARVYIVGTTQGIFRSDNGGKSFSPRKSPAGPTLTAFAGASNAKQLILYAAVPCTLEDGHLAGGVFVSHDQADSWQRCMNPHINTQTHRTSEYALGDLPQYSNLLASDFDPFRAYVYCTGTSFYPPNHSTIYRTDDAGEHWAEVFFADPRFKECNLEYDWMTDYLNQSWIGKPLSLEISFNPNQLLFTDPMFFVFTTDGGTRWQVGHTHLASPIGARDPSWSNNGLVETTAWHHYVDPHNANRHYICYTDIGFARSTDAGKTWHWWGATTPRRAGVGRHFPVPDNWANTCYELAFDPDVPGRVWGAFSEHHDIPNENSIWVGTGKSKLHGGVARSEDFATTWTPLLGALPEAPILSIVLDPKSPKGKRTLYAAVYDHGVYKSDDDGKTWSNQGNGLGDEADLRVCRLQLHRDGTLFALVTGMRVPAAGPFTSKGAGLYRSTDGAVRWEKVSAARPLLYPKDFTVDPVDSRAIYIGAADLAGAQSDREQGGLYRSVDAGITWQRILRKRSAHFGAYLHPNRKGWIYATATGWSGAADGGLWLSKDNGATFDAMKSFPFSQVQRIEFDPTDDDVIYVSTFGASVWRGPAEP